MTFLSTPTAQVVILCCTLLIAFLAGVHVGAYYMVSTVTGTVATFRVPYWNLPDWDVFAVCGIFTTMFAIVWMYAQDDAEHLNQEKHIDDNPLFMISW